MLEIKLKKQITSLKAVPYSIVGIQLQHNRTSWCDWAMQGCSVECKSVKFFLNDRQS